MVHAVFDDIAVRSRIDNGADIDLEKLAVQVVKDYRQNFFRSAT